MNRQRRYLETISSQVASLSISNITQFYVNYIKTHLEIMFNVFKVNIQSMIMMYQI